MGSGELTEWRAFYGLHPFGEDRADLRMGILASLTANINRDKKRKAFAPQDFMPFCAAPESDLIEPKTPEEEARAVEALFHGLGVEIIEKKNG